MARFKMEVREEPERQTNSANDCTHREGETLGKCLHAHRCSESDLGRREMRQRREVHLAAVLPTDGLLPLTMLIKPHSATGKAKGLNMEMSDGGRMMRTVGYDLYFSDDLPGLHRINSIS